MQLDRTAGAIMANGEVAAFIKVTAWTIYRLAGAKQISAIGRGQEAVVEGKY
jgi:hypothetical protein